MRKEASEVLPGPIAVAGPSLSGKSKLADTLITDGESDLGISVMPVHKYVTRVRREDDLTSRAQIFHYVTEQALQTAGQNQELAFTYTHKGRPYAVGRVLWSDAERALVPIPLNHEGTQELIHTGGFIPDILLRTALVYTGPNDVAARSIARGEGFTSVRERLDDYTEQMEVYLDQMHRYPLVFSTRFVSSLGNAWPSRAVASELVNVQQSTQIRRTYDRLCEAIRANITDPDDNEQYIIGRLNRLMRDGSQLLPKVDTGTTSPEIFFSQEDIETYAAKKAKGVDAVVAMLPKHLLGHHRGYGIQTLLFDTGRAYNPNNGSLHTLIDFFSHVLGHPQYIDESGNSNTIFPQGLCQIAGSRGAITVASWGFRDVPLRTVDMPLDRLVIGVVPGVDYTKLEVTRVSEAMARTIYDESHRANNHIL